MGRGGGLEKIDCSASSALLLPKVILCTKLANDLNLAE